MGYAGLLLGALILSLKTGLLLGTSWLRWKKIILFTLIFSIILLSLIVIFSQYASFLTWLLDRYTFWFAVAAAFLLIYLGVEDPLSAQSDGANRSLKKCAYLFSFLPCPLCLVALALAVTLSAPLLGLKTLSLGLAVSSFFALTTVVTGFGAKRVFRSPGIFNDLLFFLGITTLAFAFVLPNVTQAASLPASPVSLPPLRELLFIIGGAMLIWLLGFRNFKRGWSK